jgi:transposase
LVDALGNAVGFFLSGGQAHDLIGADHLLPTMKAGMLLADKAYDADERVIAVLQAAGKTAVIPSKANRKVDRGYDRATYKSPALDREFLRRPQAIQSHRHALR